MSARQVASIVVEQSNLFSKCKMLIVFKKEEVLLPNFMVDRKSVWFGISYAEKYYSKDRFWFVVIMQAGILGNSCA